MQRTLLFIFLITLGFVSCNSQKSSNQPEPGTDTTKITDTSNLLTGKKWILKELNGVSIVDTSTATDKKPIFLEFKAEKTINGFGGCNG